MNGSPDVSVVIRAYNAESTIARALKSALEQDFKGRYEVLIVDDGSTDETVSIVRLFNDNRIRLIVQENKGVPETSRVGLEASMGEIVMLLDADDESLPHTLRVVAHSLSDASIDYAYGDYREEYRDRIKLVKATDPFKVPAGAIAWRRDRLLAAGGLVGETIFPEYELLLSNWNEWRGVHIPQPLFVYHRSDTSITGDKQLVFRSIGILRSKFPERTEQINMIRNYDPLSA